MITYLFVDVIVLFLGYLFTNSKKYSIDKKNNFQRKVLYYLVGAVLVFVSAFRGNFSKDYDGYMDMYYRFSDLTIDQIIKREWFSYPEKGYLIFQRLVKILFDNPIYIFIFTSLIIVALNLFIIHKSVDNDFFALFLFLEAGVYYSSFNLTRQILAASITMIGINFIYKKQLVPYIVIVLLATSIHQSAFVMILFYFIAQIKFKKSRVALLPIVFIILFMVLPFMVSTIQRYYWTWYDQSTTSDIGYSWKNVVVPLAIVVVSFACYLTNNNEKNTEKENDNGYLIENVGLYSTFLYASLYLLGMRLKMVQRFSTFFSTMTICFFCNQVVKSKYKDLIILISVVILILFGYITKDDFPYYFVWSQSH